MCSPTPNGIWTTVPSGFRRTTGPTGAAELVDPRKPAVGGDGQREIVALYVRERIGGVEQHHRTPIHVVDRTLAPREVFGDLDVDGLPRQGGARNQIAAAGGQIDGVVLVLFIALRVVVNDDVIGRRCL